MLDLPAIYAEYGESWLPQMLWACVGTLRLSAVSFLLAPIPDSGQRHSDGTRLRRW